MNARTKLLIAGSATALVLAGSSMTHAASTINTSPDSLVSQIATHFNLNKSDVQGIFDQNHANKMAQHQEDETAQLDKAVTDGTITATQKDLIITKQAELESKFEALKSEDATTRKADMKKLMDNTKVWATTNKIDLKWLRGELMEGHGRMHHDEEPPTTSSLPITN